MCGPPDSILFEVTDPEKLKFAGTDKIYCCPTCGWTWLSSDPKIRRRERIGTIIPEKPGAPFVVAVKSEQKDKLKGTAHSRVADIDVDLEPGDGAVLSEMGMQIQKEEIKSSVSGHTAIKTFDDRAKKHQ